jgi:uncharacterized membrane protein YfcA
VFPILGPEYLGGFIVILMLFVSNAGGLGGGGVVISTAALFYNFDTMNGISLSNMSIFFTALVRLIINRNKKHPLNPWATEIDYNISTIMMPFAIIG